MTSLQEFTADQRHAADRAADAPQAVPLDTDWVPEAIRFGRDPESGAEVVQLTSEPVTSTNIYCEQRFASADGSRIAIHRSPFGQSSEMWVCDLNTMRLCRIDQGVRLGANPRRNAIYYHGKRNDRNSLICLDLAAMTTRLLFHFDDDEKPMSGAISPDERWFVGGPYAAGESTYALRLMDTATGRSQTLCEIRDMFNPHLQFDPANPNTVVVQINRGGQRDRARGKDRLASKLGATLCLVDITTGGVKPLPVGRPNTPPISGHECWLGLTGQLLFTAGQYNVSSAAHVTYAQPPEEERDMPAAAIYAIAADDAHARVVSQGLLFNHLAASDDGRFFIADDHTTGRIYIGSVATGRYLPLCDSHTRQGLCQHSHAHAYMTPDNRHVIFNSIVTGSAQVFAATVPDGFLDQVLSLS